MRGDEHEGGGGGSPDIDVGVEESLGRFEGRTSTSSSETVWSAAISEVDESASGKSRPRTPRSIVIRHVRQQPIMPPRPRPKPKARSGNSQPLKEAPPSQDEEDSIFIKSGNLTTATWKQMNKMPSGVFHL